MISFDKCLADLSTKLDRKQKVYSTFSDKVQVSDWYKFKKGSCYFRYEGTDKKILTIANFTAKKDHSGFLTDIEAFVKSTDKVQVLRIESILNEFIVAHCIKNGYTAMDPYNLSYQIDL